MSTSEAVRPTQAQSRVASEPSDAASDAPDDAASGTSGDTTPGTSGDAVCDTAGHGSAPDRARGRARRFGLDDITAVLVYLAIAMVLMARLWLNPRGRTLDNWQDTILFEWFLQHAADALTHGTNPFTTDLLNSPYGLNVLANTSALGLAVPLAPLTILAGSAVTFAVIVTLAPVATAASWYYVLDRHIVRARGPAFVGGLFAGFAPAMITQNDGHIQVSSQFLLPFLVLAVLRMRQPRRWLRTGLQLAALVVVQTFIGEETLFLTALSLLLFLLAMLVGHPRQVLPHVWTAVKVCAVALGGAGAVLAYPLYHQFFGPMSYRGIPPWFRDGSGDLGGFTAYATESLAGSPTSAAHLAPNLTEENTFFGWGLILLVGLIVVRLWRVPPVLPLAFTALVMGAWSLGPHLLYRGEPTGHDGPWRYVADLPLFDSVIPTRLGLAITPIFGVLLAIATARFTEPPPTQPAWLARVGGSGGVRGPAGSGDDRSPAAGGGDRGPAGAGGWSSRWTAWGMALVAALGPIAPTPMHVADRPPTPLFFTSGSWKRYLPAERAVVVPLAPGWGENIDVLNWQVVTGLEFATSGGYFLAPDLGAPEKSAIVGPSETATAKLLNTVSREERPAYVGDAERRQAVKDLRTWRATTMIMADYAHSADVVRLTVDDLVGRGTHVQDVWLWDVRGLTGSG